VRNFWQGHPLSGPAAPIVIAPCQLGRPVQMDATSTFLPLSTGHSLSGYGRWLKNRFVLDCAVLRLARPMFTFPDGGLRQAGSMLTEAWALYNPFEESIIHLSST
jgi:hypothetical protein